MTVIPTVEDSPDFTRKSQFTSSPIINEFNTATSTPKVIGSFYTGGYESLLVRVTNMAPGVGWVVKLAWYGNDGFATELGQVNLRTLSAIPISAQIPNRGAWCQVSVTTNTVAAKQFELQVLPRTGTPSGAGAFLDGLVHGGSAASIAGAGSLTQNAFGLTPGEACLSVATNAASWSAELVALDELSAVIGAFAGLNSSGGSAQMGRLILPTSWTQLVLRNNDAGAKFFDYAVQAAL